jgi:hypothetical protein
MPSTVSTRIQTMERTTAETYQDLVLRCLKTSCWERVGAYCESVDEYAVQWAIYDKVGSEYRCNKKDDG